MAVPSILVAVIAIGVQEKARLWEGDVREEKEIGAEMQVVGWWTVDRPRCRIRPRDSKLCLAAAATPDEAEPRWKDLGGLRSHEGRGSEMIPFAANKDD
jgi:hypothetical protein